MWKHIVVASVLSLAGLGGSTALGRSETESPPGSPQQKKEGERFCILFLDVGGIPDAEDFAEGRLLAEALRYKLKFDYTYRGDPEMSRLYPAVDLDHLYAGTDTRALMERAGRIELVADVLTGAQPFVDLLEKHRPNVVHVLAHGAGKGTFEEASWSDHKGQVFPLTKVKKALAASKLDLGKMCLVTPGCDLGRDKVMDGLKSMGFGCVIAWPGSVCASEALEFEGDLYEALVSQFILHRGAEPFWTSDDGCPPALRKAFDFATKSLQDRYRLLDEHFQDVAGRPDVAGYYLHTPSWSGEPYEYAATPALRCGR